MGLRVATCLDARTGRVLWEEECDRGFWGSLIAADDSRLHDRSVSIVAKPRYSESQSAHPRAERTL